MTTNTAGTTARLDPRQVSNTLKRTLNFNDSDVALAPLGTTAGGNGNPLPQGAFITDVKVEIVTAFNAGSTNVITVGTNTATFNNIVASGDVNPAATGVTSVARGWGRSIANASDTTVFATYTQTGNTATTGQAVIVITYEGGWKS